MRKFIFMVCLALFTGYPFCSRADSHPQDALKFCVFPNKSPKILYSMYNPIVQRLSKATGRKMVLVTAPDKKTFQQRAIAGEYDLAVACIACYFKLRDSAGYRPIVRGEPSFRGGVIVKNESTITEPLQLQGRKVAAMRKHSYAGYLFFNSYLKDHGVTGTTAPDFLFLDQLESVVYSVLTGQADACVVRLDALNSSKVSRYKDQLRVILESIDIPQFPMIVSPTLPPEETGRIISTLTSLQPADPAAEKLFKGMSFTSFTETSDTDYAQFEQAYKKALEQAGESER